MLRRESKVDEKKSIDQSGSFSTNPINSKIKKENEICFEKEINAKNISLIVDYIHSMSENEVKALMTHKNGIIRGIAARAFVDKNPELLLETLKIMLTDKNEDLRDSAVTALCYLNSPDNLNLLKGATEDPVDKIKLRALTGIADLAIEHSLQEAKSILSSFSNHKSKEIREFVSDELSIM